MRRIGIVNRGEAAVRFLRTLDALRREGGDAPESVALYTDPDADSLYVRSADGAVNIGEGRLAYLDAETVVGALQWARCDAAWLGWGFASEDADFAAALEAAGITLLAPRPDTMRALGDKIAAKRLAERLDVPVAPWAIIEDPRAARAEAERIGFPLLLKASGGGGGRGIRRVDQLDGLEAAFADARLEAQRAFRSNGVMMERLVPRARHVEVQVLGDGAGDVRVVGLRDCSLQRRRQKIIEECPAAGLDPRAERLLLDSARRLCAEVRYRSAGTVEFLYDPYDHAVYFLEVNTRLQVEHPITEEVYGLDLVRAQIDIARGLPLPEVPPPRGWAFEARVCAEDPQNGFVPAPGRLVRLQPPIGPGVRVDAGFGVGEDISAEFDSLVAKVIAWGPTRTAALARLGCALEEMRIVVEGGLTNLDFLRRLTERADVRAGEVDTGLVDRLDDTSPPGADAALLAAAIDRFLVDGDRHGDRDRHRVEVGGPISVYRLARDLYRVVGDEGALNVALRADDAYQSWLELGARRHRIEHAPGDETYVVDGVAHRVARGDAGLVTAPALALVLKVLVGPGEPVAKGQPVAVLESMKMEVRVEAPRSGEVREVRVAPGEQVRAGQVVMVVEGREAVRRRAPSLPWEAALPPGEEAPGRLCAAIVGWDREPELFATDVARLGDVGRVESVRARRRAGDPAEGSRPARDATFRAGLHAVLRAYADVAELFERRPSRSRGAGGAADAVSTAIQLETLRRRGPNALPPARRELMARVLAWHGVTSLEPGPTLTDALLRVERAGLGLTACIPAVVAALRAVDECPVELLDRLAALDPDRFRPVCEAADRARYELFERPAHERLKLQAEARAASLLDRLRRGQATWQDLLDAPESLLGAMAPEAAAGCPVAAEAVARRLEWSRPELAFAALQAAGRPVFRVGEGEEAVLMVTCRPPEAAPVVEALRGLAPLRRLSLVVVPADDEQARRREEVLEGLARELRVGGFGPPDPWPWRELCVMAVTGREVAGIRRYHPDGTERVDRRDILPTTARRLDLTRLERFDFERLPADGDVVLFLARAKDNPDDARLLAYAEVRSLRRQSGRPLHLPHVDRVFHEAVRAVQAAREVHDPDGRLQWNRITLQILPIVPMGLDVVRAYIARLAPAAERIGLEKVVIRLRFMDPRHTDGVTPWMDLSVSNLSGHAPDYALRPASRKPLMPRTRYESRVVAARRRGLIYPYEIVTMLEGGGGLPAGSFEEHDLDASGRAVSVDQRPRGENDAGVVFGVMRTRHPHFPDGIVRVLLLNDPTRRMGALAEPECRRVIAAIDLAERMGVPLEWVAVSSGARIDWETGTENLDWTARVLRRIVGFTQAGGEIDIIVPGLCVGAQAYWNAEATMMMHTRGLLIMTDRGSMVLTGKRALDFSGCVSAEDDLALGGYTTIMGPNGQAQAHASDLGAAYRLLYRYHELTYVPPGHRRPPPAPTSDPADRDVGQSPYPAELGHGFATVGEVLSEAHNPERKRPFAIRPVMSAVADRDVEPLERWGAMQGAETVVVWETRVGGHAATLIGVDNQPVARLGRPSADGPERFAGGTLYPQASRKLARALNAASGRRPAVVLANLSGFDGSPESLSRWQLEYGAEIGRAVVNFDGPILFAVVSRYHGGAYVVFSKALNPQLNAVALEGTYASVIGGAPAAAVVFAGDVRRQTVARGGGDSTRAAVTAELAAKFDAVHTIERARRVGSIDEIIPPARLRPYIIERLALDRSRFEGGAT